MNISNHSLEKLLMTSSINDEEKEYWSTRINELKSGEVDELVKYLLIHQLEPIESGFNYNQTDINRKLDNILLNEKK